jgi:hypothetical protein
MSCADKQICSEGSINHVFEVLKDTLLTLVTIFNYSLNLKPFGPCLVELPTPSLVTNVDDDLLGSSDGTNYFHEYLVESPLNLPKLNLQAKENKFVHFLDLFISSNLEDFDANFAPFVVYSFDDFSCHEIIIGFDFIDHNNSEPLVSKQTH